MKSLEKRLTANAAGSVRVAFVVTAGGSMASNTEDMVETKDALGTVSKNIFFVDGTDAYSDLAIMISMDALVLSAGSFSWWSGYLSQAADADRLIIAPHLLYQPSHPLSNAYHVEDYYPPNWELLEGADGQTVTRFSCFIQALLGSRNQSGSSEGLLDVCCGFCNKLNEFVLPH